MKMNVLYKIALIAFSAVAMSGEFGCNTEEGNRMQASQDDEPHSIEKAAAITHFTDRVEIFIEHRFVLAEEPTRFITHITDLQTAEPLRTGPVIFLLRKGNQLVKEHIEQSPVRDGIYVPELMFPEAGTWELHLRIPVQGSEHYVELPPTQVYASVHDVEQAATPEEVEGIPFLKEQQWKVGVTTKPVQRQSVTEQLFVSGVVSAKPESKATVSPPVAGRLLKAPHTGLPVFGQVVEVGQVLAVVQPPLAGSDVLALIGNQNQIQVLHTELAVKMAEAEAQLSHGKVAVERTENTLNRVRGLYEKDVKSARELEEAEFAYRQAAVAYESASTLKREYHKAINELASLLSGSDLSGGFPTLDIRAPISGVVTTIEATVGEYIQPGELTFQILNTDEVLIEAKVPEAHFSGISDSFRASYETPDKPGTFIPILGAGPGKLIHIDRQVHPTSRTISLHYQVPNDDGRLRPGMALNVYIQTKHAERALVIPDSSLIDEDGRFTVFVQLAGETFEKRDIEVGIRDHGWVQVISGLTEGERVVSQGAYAIRLASVSTSIPAQGHVH